MAQNIVRKPQEGRRPSRTPSQPQKHPSQKSKLSQKHIDISILNKQTLWQHHVQHSSQTHIFERAGGERASELTLSRVVAGEVAEPGHRRYHCTTRDSTRHHTHSQHTPRHTHHTHTHTQHVQRPHTPTSAALSSNVRALRMSMLLHTIQIFQVLQVPRVPIALRTENVQMSSGK